MFTNLNDNTKGIILALMGFSAFALADANAKYLTLTYDSSHVVGVVAIFSSVSCLVLSPFLGGLKNTLKTKKMKFHLARGAMNILVGLLIVFSFSKLTLAGVYSMIFITPFVIALISIPIFKEKIEKAGWIAIIGGFIGVMIIARPGVSDLDPYLLVPLGTTIFIALLFLFARPLDEDETLISLAFYPAWANMIVITPIVLYVYGLPATEDFYMFFVQAALVITGLINTAIAFRIAKASIVAPFMYIEIVWAIGFDTYVFKQPPDLWTLIGGSVIIVSGLYLIEIERRVSFLDVSPNTPDVS